MGYNDAGKEIVSKCLKFLISEIELFGVGVGEFYCQWESGCGLDAGGLSWRLRWRVRWRIACSRGMIRNLSRVYSIIDSPVHGYIYFNSQDVWHHSSGGVVVQFAHFGS